MRVLRSAVLSVAMMLTAVGAYARPHTAPAAASSTSSDAYYTNVSGHRVHRPMHAASRPAGATARCGDGSYSFSEHHRGTCSHHGGVATWF